MCIYSVCVCVCVCEKSCELYFIKYYNFLKNTSEMWFKTMKQYWTLGFLIGCNTMARDKKAKFT